MRNIKTFLILLGLYVMVPIAAQTQLSPVERAFIAMPDEYHLPLSTNGRKSLLSTYYADTTSSYRNRFGGQSKITFIDAKRHFLRVKNSDEGIVELQLLTKNDSVDAIALAFTTCAPLCDSHIGFFAPDWTLLSYPLTPNINVDCYIDLDAIKKANKTKTEIADQVDLAFLQSTFHTTDNQLQITLHLQKSVEEDTYKRLRPFFKGNQLHLKWNGDKYVITACDWEDKSIK